MQQTVQEGDSSGLAIVSISQKTINKDASNSLWFVHEGEFIRDRAAESRKPRSRKDSRDLNLSWSCLSLNSRVRRSLVEIIRCKWVPLLFILAVAVAMTR